jgi:hypothetical protein
MERLLGHVEDIVANWERNQTHRFIAIRERLNDFTGKVTVSLP